MFTCIAQISPPILLPSGFSPHLVSPMLSDTAWVSQTAEIAQFISGQALNPIPFATDIALPEWFNGWIPLKATRSAERRNQLHAIRGLGRLSLTSFFVLRNAAPALFPFPDLTSARAILRPLSLLDMANRVSHVRLALSTLLYEIA